MSDELVRVAHHEAGHAAMAHVLGVAPGLITIRPGPNYRGVAHHGRTGQPEVRETDLDVPIVEMRAQLRRGVEREILICLAGKATERLAPVVPYVGFRLPDDPELRSAVADCHQVLASRVLGSRKP